ncbi:uncharacterized protein ARMOST_20924 [Armillaria ostoyae]|uniref:Uncharacterized protein n=1 Tax=Armillaria ostoyae TaxID=47428 RepID=A0A284S8P4_ARMOS|nr:uncharacterized protein ARMOST_20924 [Armillaria ostoyae]
MEFAHCVSPEFFVAAYECGVNCSDWYTFLRELLPSGLHNSCRCHFLHETYGSDSILGDVFTAGVDASASSSFVSPHITTSCPFLALESPVFQRGILIMRFLKKQLLCSLMIPPANVMLPCSHPA